MQPALKIFTSEFERLLDVYLLPSYFYLKADLFLWKYLIRITASYRGLSHNFSEQHKHSTLLVREWEE